MIISNQVTNLEIEIVAPSGHILVMNPWTVCKHRKNSKTKILVIDTSSLSVPPPPPSTVQFFPLRKEDPKCKLLVSLATLCWDQPIVGSVASRSVSACKSLLDCACLYFQTQMSWSTFTTFESSCKTSSQRQNTTSRQFGYSGSPHEIVSVNCIATMERIVTSL